MNELFSYYYNVIFNKFPLSVPKIIKVFKKQQPNIPSSTSAEIIQKLQNSY